MSAPDTCIDTCTGLWDQLDVIADEPVPEQIYPLLLTHQAAHVLLTVRDPWQWRLSRIKHHRQKSHRQYWTPCGEATTLHTHETRHDETLEVLDVVSNACSGYLET